MFFQGKHTCWEKLGHGHNARHISKGVACLLLTRNFPHITQTMNGCQIHSPVHWGDALWQPLAPTGARLCRPPSADRASAAPGKLPGSRRAGPASSGWVAAAAPSRTIRLTTSCTPSGPALTSSCTRISREMVTHIACYTCAYDWGREGNDQATSYRQQ